MDLSFDQLRAANVERCETAFHSVNEWEPWDWTNALAGEAGEACNITKKMHRLVEKAEGKIVKTWNKPEDGNLDELTERLAGEIADVVIYADLLAARIGKSLADCVRQKFNEKSEEIGSPIRLNIGAFKYQGEKS